MLRLRHYERISIGNQRFCTKGVSLAQNLGAQGVAPHTQTILFVGKLG